MKRKEEHNIGAILAKLMAFVNEFKKIPVRIMPKDQVPNNSEPKYASRRRNAHNFRELQAKSKRFYSHTQACQQGYENKIAMVKQGKGNNTISGIPM